MFLAWPHYMPAAWPKLDKENSTFTSSYSNYLLKNIKLFKIRTGSTIIDIIMIY